MTSIERLTLSGQPALKDGPGSLVHEVTRSAAGEPPRQISYPCRERDSWLVGEQLSRARDVGEAVTDVAGPEPVADFGLELDAQLAARRPRPPARGSPPGRRRNPSSPGRCRC